MTREQKFAWAVKNGVTPPAWFFAQQTPPPSKPSCCCAKRGDKVACSTTDPNSATSSPRAGNRASGGKVAIIDALRCNGESMLWAVTVPTSLRPDIVRDLLTQSSGSPLIGEPALIFCSPCFDPAVPPPRCG